MNKYYDLEKAKKAANKKHVFIVVDGKPIKNLDCDECNYCECESCPTWHGEEVKDNEAPEN